MPYGALDHAVQLLGVTLAGQTYGDTYLRLADAALYAPLPPELVGEGRTVWGDADRLNPDFALGWVRRVAAVNILAGTLLADALAALSTMTNTLSYRDKSFPTRQHVRVLGKVFGVYYVQFQVHDGAAYDLAGTLHGPGFRGLAAVERCHLGRLDGQPVGYGLVPQFGRCPVLLGFDLPCTIHPGTKMVFGRVVPEVEYTPPIAGCLMPYGFITGAWRGDSPDTMNYEPKLSLDAAVELAISLRDDTAVKK